ncbi:MAG TPA: DUF1653 domain-containing protein [Candidatus Acetatifactor stercoripullorum]|uniref:DUF1653 domain-containing protein n=1 Tax=Candidatus Acetatifactor stercoripullorum TaxID=2838414 RepID=A0A9D1UB80_9FIRM|nr:DUF1653 domain-containing protein [uncultured Acetatifactor sp.]HIW80025.1 DUF1653 domain-containing protein [Candidatus Acetatifactor stercoripullorum]
MSFIPKPHEIYKHFKGNLYQITAIAQHSETGEQLVVYQALYGDFKTYARPLDMFISRVDREKYPDAVQEYRFELQGADSQRQKERLEQPEPPDRSETSRQPEPPDRPEISRQPEPPESEEQVTLDPLVLEFLDADSYEQRLNILAGLHHRITDDMITTMAIACDIEVNDGDVEERYEALKNCLLTLEKYECNRLR